MCHTVCALVIKISSESNPARVLTLTGVVVCPDYFMAGITDLEITYGSALAPPGYRKVSLPDGGQAELNRGSGKSPSFLWYHVGAGRGDPVVEIILVHEDGIERPGFEKIPRNILKGSGQSAFIYVRRGVDLDPIGDIRIVYGTDLPGDFFRSLHPFSHLHCSLSLSFFRPPPPCSQMMDFS
jgi:hypothetical protein